MLRYFALLLALLCALTLPVFAEEAEPFASATISGTGLCVDVPADWTIEVSSDEHSAVVLATSPDGARELLVFRNQFDQWDLPAYRAELEKGSAHNRVTDIQDWTCGERAFVTYAMTPDDNNLQSWCAVTEVSAHLFVTLEFRTRDGSAPADAFGALLDTLPASLRAEEPQDAAQ